MEIIITKAAPEDARQLLDYLKQVGGETDNLSFGAEGLPFTLEQEQAHIASLADSPDGVILVAKADGKIIGDASLQRQPRRMNHRGTVGISVVKACWGQGVGTRLMEALIAFARENSFELLDLEVRCDNPRAIGLYEKCGFQKLCTYPGFCKIDGQHIDFDFMVLKV